MKRVLLRQLPVALLLAVSVSCAFAQQAAPADDVGAGQRNWDIKPNIGIDFTQTDNVNLQAENRQSDLIMRVSPGVRVQGKSARATAYADFQLQQVNYLQANGQDRVQRAFNAVGNVELIDDFLFLDMNGRISRQAISAFAAPSSGSDSINANVTEASSYQLSPYIKGRLFGNTDYLLRFDNTWYDAKNGSIRNTYIQGLQASLSGAIPLSKLSWGIDANKQQVEYDGSSSNKNETDALRASLTYMLDPQFRIKAIGGRESNDYVDFQQQTTSITGFGLEWAPTDRTLLDYTRENRYFGEGHRFNFTHRTAFTAWRISDTRDAYVRAPQSMTYSMGTYFELLNLQYQSAIPDNAQRAQFVQSLLQTMNVSPNANVIGGYMTPRASIDRNKEASFTWTGTRNLVAVSAQDQNRTALGTGIGIPDDFSTYSPVIRQRGINANWSYKLTPTASLALLGSKSRTSGQSSNLDIDRKLYSLILSNKLGAYTTGSIGFRKTEVTGFVNYDENAILASLLMIF